jgi:hypothetical protein
MIRSLDANPEASAEHVWNMKWVKPLKMSKNQMRFTSTLAPSVSSQWHVGGTREVGTT